MKKLILIIAVTLAAVISYGQAFPVTNAQGAPNTLSFSKGGIQAGVGIINTTYTDTTTANLNTYLKNYAGAQIYTTSDNNFWLRNTAVGVWTLVGGSGLTGNAGTVASIALLQAYSDTATTVIVTDSLRGGIFHYFAAGLTVNGGTVFTSTGKGSGFWSRAISNANQINPLWWGLTLNDSTVDNAPLINAALKYASSKGQSVTLNDSGFYGIQTSVIIPRSTGLIIGEKVNIVHYGLNGVPMFTMGDSASLKVEGVAYLNKRIATGLLMDGYVNTYKTATTHIQFNVKGDNLLGQKGVELISDGHGVYGSAPVGYINDFNIIARDLDYFIYASATNQGNINNLRIKIEAGNCIHGIYLFSDTTTTAASNYTTGRTSLAYLNLEGNLRVGQSTETMLYMDGVIESVIDLKIEDYGRYADTALPTAAIYITSRSKQNTFRVKSFKPQFIHDEGVGNTFDVHQNTGGTFSQDLSPQNSSIYPNATVTRFAGGLQSDFLFGSGSLYNAALGNGAKPNIIVSTNSNTTDSLYNMFMEEVDPTSGNVAIYDANTTEKTIKIAIDHAIQGHTMGVEFGTAKYAPRYCKIEAWSVDSLKKYTLTETDTNWNGTNLIAVFAGKLLKNVTKCYQLGINTVCKSAVIGSYLYNVDTLYITVKGNNWKDNVDNIKINKIWLLVDSENPKNVITSVGVDGQNNTIYQPIKAYGDFDFYNADIDMHGDTIRNAFVYGAMQNMGNITNFDAASRFAGFYTFNHTTTGTLPPSSTGIGTVIFSIISASTPFWDGTQGATMVAIDNTGNVFTRAYNSVAWSAWAQLGAAAAYTFSTGLTNSASTITANLSTGIAGGQSVIGGTASGNNLTYSSTSNATKGNHIFGTTTKMIFNETDGQLGLGVATPAASSIVDITSTTKGFLMPRMTTVQRDAISSPATGLQVYNTTTNSVDTYNGTNWGTPGTLQAASYPSVAINASTTGYTFLSGQVTATVATEANRGIILPTACKAGLLYIYTTSAQPASGSLVATIRKNGVATGLTITIAANAVAGTYTNTSTLVSFAAGDLLTLQWVNNATGSSANINAVSFVILP